ncbi:MAG TPA: DUF1027 domain-containing protein [Bacilli bacterium]|nr:DUF1027 domain-containing protein [Bacilli bacterium]
MQVNINNIKYEITTNYKDGFDEEEVKNKCTEYFNDFDYIVGDWAYGKLRLKGFYDKSNKNCKPINNIENLDKYIKDYCAFDCKYFIAKKINI